MINVNDYITSKSSVYIMKCMYSSKNVSYKNIRIFMELKDRLVRVVSI